MNAKAVKRTLGVVVTAMAVMLVLLIFSGSAKAAGLNEPTAPMKVEFISVLDGSFVPVGAKYATMGIGTDGSFTMAARWISGYKPVRVIPWTQKGRASGRIVASSDYYDIIGSVTGNQGANEPARFLIVYERDVEMLSLKTEYYLSDGEAPGMGGEVFEEKGEDGRASFTLRVEDKIVRGVSGKLVGLDVSYESDGKDSVITLKTSKNLVASVYYGEGGAVDYIFTSPDGSGAVILALQRRTVKMKVSYHYDGELDPSSGEEFELTMGDDGWTTGYLNLKEGCQYAGGAGFSEIVSVFTEAEEGSEIVERIGIVTQQDIDIDVYYGIPDIEFGKVDKYAIATADPEDNTEIVIFIASANGAFEGPPDLMGLIAEAVEAGEVTEPVGVVEDVEAVDGDVA